MRLRQALSGFFHFRNRIGIQQFAQVRLAQQLAQLVLVDRQCLRPALGQRGIAVIQKICHVAE